MWVATPKFVILLNGSRKSKPIYLLNQHYSNINYTTLETTYKFLFVVSGRFLHNFWRLKVQKEIIIIVLRNLNKEYSRKFTINKLPIGFNQSFLENDEIWSKLVKKRKLLSVTVGGSLEHYKIKNKKKKNPWRFDLQKSSNEWTSKKLYFSRYQ